MNLAHRHTYAERCPDGCEDHDQRPVQPPHVRVEAVGPLRAAAGEVAKVVQSIRNEYLAAERQETSLTEALNQQKTEALARNQSARTQGTRVAVPMTTARAAAVSLRTP